MSWHYLQGQEAVSWEGSSLDGAPSALLRLIPTPAASCSQGKPTDALNRSPFGMTCEPLTASRGPDELTLCQGDSHVPTLQRASAMPKALTAQSLDFGEKWQELSVRFDRASRSWKTHLCLWEEVLPWSSVTLPKWGMAADGVVWEGTSPDFPITAPDCGWLPTPTTSSAESHKNDAVRFDCLSAWCRARFGAGYPNPRFWETIMGWPVSWTDAGQSATAKYQEWRQWHGGF